MSRSRIHWVNTPVLMEALMRYQQGRLPRQMRLWVEQLLEIKENDKSQLLENRQ